MSEEIILEARDIWHSYEENDRFSLQGLDLKVKKGSKVAFMGSQRFWKIYVFSLLQRNLRPQKGDIFVSWKTGEPQKGTSGTSIQGGDCVSGPG